MYGVALAVYAYEAGGAKLVGLLFCARWGASAVCAPWLGLLADRFPRRQVMVAADFIRVGALALMAVLARPDRASGRSSRSRCCRRSPRPPSRRRRARCFPCSSRRRTS